MAVFQKAFEKTLAHEGGYQMTDVPGDHGGQTYAGISRNAWPHWEGWQNPSPEAVRKFYHDNFWEPIQGLRITHQETADDIFDFAVNAGVKTAVKIAQRIVSVEADGIVGPLTLIALNVWPGRVFKDTYTIERIKHYAMLCNRDRSQSKFLLGWINRVLA